MSEITILNYNYDPTDIDREFARRAFSALSHTPEKRGDQYVDGYVAEMAEMAERFQPYATSQNLEQLNADLETYRTTYISKLNAYLSALGRCMSAFITGSANFPTARNQKRNDVADKRRDEWLDWMKKAKLRLERKYNPVAIANAPISSDDEDAIRLLQVKIDKAEKFQATMKAANTIVRKKKLSDDEKVELLIQIGGISEETAQGLLSPDFAGRLGFPSYQLTNNGAKIRQTKKRIVELQREVDRDEVDDRTISVSGTACTLVENTDMNRLQLVFDGKPPDEVLEILNAHGFNWAPSQDAWQRQLNSNARRTVEIIRDKQ